jgi:phage tail-like protein
MRFTVSVGGLSLGHWSGCKGLKMDFRVSRLREGGNYGFDRILPDQVVGAAVTLERAIDRDDSAKVQVWLSTVAREWTSYLGKGQPYQERSAQIALFDAAGTQVASWTLHGVFPSSWSGPSLSATANQVAIETLVLEYQAMTPGTDLPTPAVSAASLSQGTEAMVRFTFSPEKITISHTAKGEEVPAATGKTSTMVTYEESLKAQGETIIGLSGLTFDGEDVKGNCEQLLTWTNGVPIRADESATLALPLLTFVWGSSQWDVKLRSADITYTRFSSAGLPIRAEATLKCISCVNPPALTNPTSGGLPGRHSHMLVAGESLPHVAMASYGRPGAWRAVARANGIEDPMRVRPGAVIYLPNSEELPARSQP